MRVAFVHSLSVPAGPGGVDAAVLDQAAALDRAGHEVRLVTGAGGYARSPLGALHAFAPDVVHVHHLAPDFGRSWATEWTGPLVATLHGPCPPGGERRSGLWQGRHRDVWLAARGGVRRDPLLRRADRAVAPSEPSRDTYLAAGMPRERLELIPHHVPAVRRGDTREHGAWVYVGRLAPETGLPELLRRWPAGSRLDVVGAGPLERWCRAAAPPSVRFLGVRERGALRRSLPGYRGLVLPGLPGDGGVPLVYLEALAAGLPVLAFEGAAVPRAVRAEGTGTVTDRDASLPAALAAADRIFPTLREHCRSVHAKRYGEAVWVERIEGLYAELVRR
ncbi:glycosyltransferase family 4 protein [Streptomyces sp. VRA16 Mangrove soil]|uniref:glycosyltransferase family 4 protein n=1 Tax=Streptomyces sp. VRA16 Mangrove soil TaxID=2817434 RepID=UPI001A9CBE87|nr:glycosyltransferase family 4 protein [Streptomyces sp. VRA16 Mangrove soil]MBO1333640.1 glycosyltransferase family 4 protein [Streptomyces sp. VRA16 Mangrove soil]